MYSENPTVGLSGLQLLYLVLKIRKNKVAKKLTTKWKINKQNAAVPRPPVSTQVCHQLKPSWQAGEAEAPALDPVLELALSCDTSQVMKYGRPPGIHHWLEDCIQRAGQPGTKQRLRAGSCAKGRCLFSLPLQPPTAATSRGLQAAHITHWLKSLLMEISRSSWDTSRSHCGNEHCRRSMSLLRRRHSAGYRECSKKGRAFAEWSRLPGQGCRRSWGRGQALPFPVRACSWWHCTAAWAPRSGREGRKCGPGWLDCTWARIGRCTAPAQTCQGEHRGQLLGHRLGVCGAHVAHPASLHTSMATSGPPGSGSHWMKTVSCWLDAKMRIYWSYWIVQNVILYWHSAFQVSPCYSDVVTGKKSTGMDRALLSMAG